MTSQWTNPEIAAESAANVAWLGATEAVVKAAEAVVKTRATGSIGSILTAIDMLQLALDRLDALRQAAMERKATEA